MEVGCWLRIVLELGSLGQDVCVCVSVWRSLFVNTDVEMLSTFSTLVKVLVSLVFECDVIRVEDMV